MLLTSGVGVPIDPVQEQLRRGMGGPVCGPGWSGRTLRGQALGWGLQ